MSSTHDPHDLFWDGAAREEPASTASSAERADAGARSLSVFEAIFTSYPPILESLLDQLPTASVLDLYQTSRYLRDFLRSYPLAWKTLSFRLPQPAAAAGSPAGHETPDNRDRHSKQYSFDALLMRVIRPYGTRLSSLDLCNTAVSGIALVNMVLAPRIDCLQHLSVRGCKNVSIKYHIVPFLEPYTVKDSPWAPKDLALKSLYTYRCRHHRRRPYLPSSLVRRDSDSDPTHQLIEICHQLGIWTDTAWCPTPGARCFRRKDYHAGRAHPQNMEVWVPFDRLWRSSNRIGPVDSEGKIGTNDGRLWEISETGQDGEALGTEDGQCKGEGKHVPAHLRKSHTTFVENITCTQCNETILERCESCSVRMHCMGCRKTLCASCAFNRPIPRKRAKTRHFANLAFGFGTLGSTLIQGSSSSLTDQNRASKPEPTNRFWWAPGATRSPNLMNEIAQDDDSSDSEDGGNLINGLPMPHANRDPPRLNMHWCCLEPMFSGGGGIAVLGGTGLGGRGADKIRAAPLPRTKEFEDPDFSNQLRPVDYIRELKNNGLYEYVLGEDVDMLSYLKQESLDLQAQTCPRALCQDCYRSFRWKISCRACKNPICKEHDFRALKFRKCGYRNLHTEREYARTHQETPRLVIPEFNASRLNGKDPDGPLAAPSYLGSELGDATPMSQSQVLLPGPTPSAVNMSTTTSISSQHSKMDVFSTASSLPFLPVSSSRPRSFSTSGVRSRNPGSWSNSPRGGPVNSITNPPPLPCNPRHPVQWEGCGAYFCQYPRPVGDHRTSCTALLKECSDCAVLVCTLCELANPTCPCTFCTINYHCPHCRRKPEVKSQCRLDEENRAREEAERRAKERMEKEKEDRGKADSVAGAAYEFWTLMGEVWTEFEFGEEDAPPAPSMPAELPTASPDSITVTTVFGVSEEPSNTTTITGGPPLPTTSPTIPEPHNEDEGVEIHHIEDITAPPHGIGAGHHHMTAFDMPFETESDIDEDLADDEDEDVDFDDDMETFDAEGALIEEFIDEGVLGPSTASSTTITAISSAANI